MTQGLGIMSHIKTPRVTASIAATIVFTSSFCVNAYAQNDVDNINSQVEIISIAAQLGLLQNVPDSNIRPAVYQQAPRRPVYQPAPRRPIYQPAPRRPIYQPAPRARTNRDPYAIRRIQIQQQNQARRKAHLVRLQQQRLQLINARKHAQRLAQTQRRGSFFRGGSNYIWGRIFQGYRIRNYNYQPLVRQFINQLAHNPQKIQRITERSSDYLYLVVTELNRRGMPTELAYLPFVESSYRNSAYSHAGAAGMWQFIPATARRYGLLQTRSYDARLDPHLATQAALSYLQKLHRQFRGDWLLALAAYNAGENRVERAIQINLEQGLPIDYWHLDLPRETRQYVPRLLAYKEILSRPAAYGLRLQGIPNAPALARIHVNKPVDLRKAAAYAGIPSKQLLALNSGFLHGITTPLFSNSIILPRSHANVLNQIIRDLPPAADVHNKRAYRGKSRRRSRRRFVRYRVRLGDNLYQIARKHGTTVKKIKRLNNIRGNRIKPGISLIIAKSRRSRKSYS